MALTGRGTARAQAPDVEPEPIRVAYTAFAADCSDDGAFARRAAHAEPTCMRVFTATVAPRGEHVERRLDVRHIGGSPSTRTRA